MFTTACDFYNVLSSEISMHVLFLIYIAHSFEYTLDDLLDLWRGKSTI